MDSVESPPYRRYGAGPVLVVLRAVPCESSDGLAPAPTPVKGAAVHQEHRAPARDLLQALVRDLSITSTHSTGER